MRFNKNKLFHKVTSSLLVLFILSVGISSNVFASGLDTREAAKYYNNLLNNSTKFEEELNRIAGQDFTNSFHQKDQGYLGSAKKYLDLWQYHKSSIEPEITLNEDNRSENNVLEIRQTIDTLTSSSDIIINNFVPNSVQWKAIGLNIFQWAEDNKYSFVPAGTDIGKFIVKDVKKNIIGEIHSGQPVKYKKDKVYQTHLHLIEDEKMHYYLYD